MNQHSNDVHSWVKEYYGEILKKSEDLQTNACCATGAPPARIAKALSKVDDAVLSTFYGCGYPIPHGLKGAKVLDLGCGTGRDVYVLSQLVGESGFVHGVDMTEAQLATAKSVVEDQMRTFGYVKPNVSFEQAYIEDLGHLEDESLDLVVSNCVVNLSPRKDLVMNEVARVLKQGGEFYFSDVFCDRRLPQEVANDPLLHSECLGGAMYLPDFIALAKRVGFADPRETERGEITIQNGEIERKVAGARFVSVTLRLFKHEELEERCEDYGQTATYLGGIEDSENFFWLDDHHLFERGRPERVCSNTALMLGQTRFAPFFKITGDTSTHFGEFPCGPTMAAQIYPVDVRLGGSAPGTSGGGCC